MLDSHSDICMLHDKPVSVLQDGAPRQGCLTDAERVRFLDALIVALLVIGIVAVYIFLYI